MSSRLRFFAVLSLLVLWPWWGAGCARMPAGALTPLAPGQLEGRVELAQAVPAQSDPVEHALALASAEHALARPDRAAAAARLALRRAESAWWMARLAGDAEATSRARRRLDQVAKEALRWAERGDDPDLVVLAVLASAHPRRHRKVLRRAVARLPQLSRDLDPAVLATLVDDDAAARRQLTRWLASEDRSRLGLDRHEADPEAYDLLLTELRRAVARRVPVAQLRERAEAVLTADPWAIDARLLVLGLDEIQAGGLDDDPLLLEDLQGPFEGSSSRLARLHLRARAAATACGSRPSPCGSPVVSLALAWWLLQADLIGDAQGVVDGLVPRMMPPPAAHLHAQLEAMTAARRGDVAALEHWRATVDARSPSLDAWLAAFDREGEGLALRAAAARALRRRARRALPLDDVRMQWAVQLDPRLDAEARDRHGFDVARGEAAAWRAICMQMHRDAAACVQLWFHEDLAAGLTLAGRTRHFHPDLIGDASELEAEALVGLSGVVAAYEGTVAAASPELEALRLRVLLARGDYAQARASLERQGALLPAYERTWAWLVLDDLEAGAVTYDDSVRWLPEYSDEVALEPSGEDEAEAPLRVDRYLQGMYAAAEGRHAVALARLMPVLDALPDEVMVEGLARASLAAHLGGDAALRDALSVRLHAVDPHGPAYARMQAKIAVGAGQPEQARRFIAHALHWHPDDVMLHRRMIELLGEGTSDSLALAFVADATPSNEYLLGSLRQQIRRGGVRTQAVMQQVRAGLDGAPEDAWAVEPALASELPWLATRALQWGLQRIREARDLDEARHWATAIFERLEASPPRTSHDRSQQVWLALLLGRVEAGLAAAARLDRERGLAPLGENGSGVMLLRARGAGEIDDALAWDFWRWHNGIDEAAQARVEALLDHAPEGSILQVFACNERTAAEDVGPAIPVCAAAWRAQPDSLALAVAESYLALGAAAAVAEAAAAEDEAPPTTAVDPAAAVFQSGVVAPEFLAQPRLALGGNLAEPWHHNRAVWLGRRGEHEAAAWSWWQAHALGGGAEPGRDQDAHAQLRHRGSLVRAQQGEDDDARPRSLDLRRSMLALAGAEPHVARAYAEMARARVPSDHPRLDRSERMLPDRLRHISAWAASDLEKGRLGADAIGEALDLVLTPELPAAQALHARHPEASLTRLALLQAHHAQAEDSLALELAETLLARHPEDPLAVEAALPLLVAAGEDERARALYEGADASHPGDALLRYADAPESITGPRDGVPEWVREPARFDARLARVGEADVRALVPARQVSIERAAELFVPLAWQPDGVRVLGFEDGQGARMLVLTSPRASRCQGEACAGGLLRGVAGQGRTQQWIRQVPFAGSVATQAMFTNAEEVLVAWVLPSGGRVFTVAIAAPIERFDALRPAVVMLRDGFRPLDAVLPPFAAESLRAAGPGVREGWRFAARREQARAEARAGADASPSTSSSPSAPCPVPETLAALAHDHQRAELLVDLWLATAQAPARQALLRCTAPRSASARRLAIVALLDEQPSVHAFGREAVRTHATRVRDDLRTILSTPLSPPVSAPDYLMRTDLPAHGLVEVLGALPRASASPVVEGLLASKDPRDRTLAMAALRMRPELATEAAIDEALASEPRMVTQAAYLLADRGEPADAQRLRDRLDAITAARTREERASLGDVALALASFLDPRDATRLRDAPSKVEDGDDPAAAAHDRERLRLAARDHARARALAEDPTLVPGDDDRRAQHWSSERHQRTLPIRSEAQLRTRSLAELLPGHDWTFARLGSPGLFAGTVTDVVERLTTGDDAVDQRLGELTSRVLRDGGLAALSASGGLDVTKAIECAKPVDDQGWLCTAHVTDREALLAVLSQRASGDDAGVSLPLTVATTAGLVPVVLSLLPAILHPLVYPAPEDDDDDDDEGDAPDVEDAAERARMSFTLGGLQLERYAIIHARTHRIGIDTERYLFVGDRLWVFSTEGAMTRVLHAHEGPMLAEDSEYQRLTAKWKDGAALQAVALGRAWPLAEGGVSMEVVLDEGGLRFRYAGAFESETGVTDIGPALAQLPPGAVTIFAHGLGRAESFRTPLKAKGSDAARLPPLPVLSEARGVAFGWYLREGDALWRRWLAVAPLDEGLRKALARAKTPAGRAGASRRHGALCYLERDGYLLVGDCALVDESAAGPPAPAASREQLRVAHAVFDGPTAAARLPSLGGLDLTQRATMRAAAPLLGIVADMQVTANWIPAERVAVLEGGVALRLRPPGDRTRVIDDWLAASEGRNAATLPRRLRGDELEGPLRYVLEVPDAEAFVRDTLADSPRIEAEVLGPTRVRMTVSPTPSPARIEPLPADELTKLTKSTKELRSDDARIIKLARRLAPVGTTPALAAEKIGAWVHEKITYEVTPRSLDGVEILEAGRGDCTEYARLTVTLLRAAGVPAEVRDGMAASGDELVAHAWVAYHDGESWHEIDPTWGRARVTAGHLEMSVLDAIALVSLGKLTIVEITVP